MLRKHKKFDAFTYIEFDIYAITIWKKNYIYIYIRFYLLVKSLFEVKFEYV